MNHSPCDGRFLPRTKLRDSTSMPPPRCATHTLLGALTNAGYEVLPLRDAYRSITSTVPLTVPLSVTMTVSKGVEATLDLAQNLAGAGYHVTPHLAARMFCDRAHVADSNVQLQHCGVTSVFVIAGDLEQPVGCFADSIDLLDYFASAGHPFQRIGIAGYPEGHARIAGVPLDDALYRKAQYADYIVTQMCFHGPTTAVWAQQIRDRGIDLPVHVGLPGVVTRQKLARISASLGLGPSARYLIKQPSMLRRFFTPGGYRPDRILNALAPGLSGNRPILSGLHFFTFNEVERTEMWRQAWMTRLQSLPCH